MKKVLLFLMFLITSPVFSQGVGINTDGSSPNTSAILDVKSTSQGVLISRMTEANKNAITSPATGLIIYQTDIVSGFYYYNGTIWVKMSVDGDNIKNGTSIQTSANYNIDGNGTLGGDINVNGQDINGSGINGGTSGILRINSNTDVRVALDKDANGSQQFEVTNDGGSTSVFSVTEAGNVTTKGYVRMLESGTTPTLYTAIQSGDLTGSNLTLTLPTSAGTSGQFLKTDGTGVTSWSTLSQSSSTTYQTAALVPTTTTSSVVTGLTTTFTADANHVYYISTTGCVYDASATTNRNVNSQVSIFVDGVVLTAGTQVACAQNLGTVSLWTYGNWSLNQVVSLTAGSHTIDVRANRRSDSNIDNPTVGGASGTVCQGQLTVMVISK
jgi:hypothetical protein